MYWFFGNPKSVFSVTGKFSDLKISTEDFSASIISFKDKIISQVHLDYFQRPVFRNCKIKGTNGVIYWNQDVNEVKLYSLKKRKWQITNCYEKNFVACIDKKENIILAKEKMIWEEASSFCNKVGSFYIPRTPRENNILINKVKKHKKNKVWLNWHSDKTKNLNKEQDLR